MKRLDVLVICALTFCLPSFALAQVFSTPLEFDHFGRMFLEGNPDHLGVDLMNGIGTAVYACGTGKVHRYEPSIAGYGGCDGQAGEVLFLKLQKNDGSTCVVQYGHVRNVPERLKSPNASVTKGEYLGELANYDPCCGGGGSCPHLHYGVWNSEENLPNEGWGYGNQGHWVEPFEFTARQNADWYVQDRGLHSVFGHYKNDPHWYHAWTEAFRAHPKNFDGTAKNCLIQEFEGGPWGGSVVYDPVGGGRRAYIVGWWQWSAWMDLGLNCGSCPHPDGHSGSSGEGGPNSCLGMPITNSYLSGPNWRQDFQKGYILDDQVWCYPSRAPGWASDDSWHSAYSYLFAEAYERNGAAVSVGQAVVYDGHPAGVSDWNGYKAQFFNGGNYGLGFVMYDPWNWDGNECATNEAYYVRTGFREYYLEEGGPSFFGCPTRDEYEIGGVPVQDFYNRNTDTYYRMEWHGTYASHYNLDPCGSGGSQGGNGDPVVLCTPDPGSILGNGDFSEGDNCWTYFAWPEERGELHLGTNTVELEIHGTGEYWSVSFSQACEIAANQYYRLFFDYESVNTLHPILVMTDANDHNQNYGLWHEFTTQRYDWFHKEVEFRATSTSSSAEFMFCVGSHNGKFRIRNARIEVIASPPPPPPSCDGDDPDSFIGNGQFYGPNCWESASPNHPYVVFNFNGQFESHVNGPYPWYDVKLSQDWVWLQAGSQCEVIWTGAVNAPSRVIVALEDGSGGHVLWEEVWLTSTEQEFTMPFWPQATNPAGKLVFYLGEVDQSVWIKDVVVRYADAPPPPPVCDGDDSESFIGNGQFYGSSCWNLADPNERGVATEYDGQFEAHVNGPYPYYDIRLSQDWVWLQDESACELVWTGAVNSPSQVIAAIEYADGSYVLWEEVTLTSTDQQFVMPFWPQATDPAGKLVFFLGDVDQSVWIKDVSVRWSSGQARALPKTSLAVSPNPAKAGGPLAVRFNLNRATSVNLEIYNVAGQLARSIDVGLLPAGGHVYDWDGRSGDGERVPSGIYFIRLRGDVESSLRRVVIVR